MGQPTEHGRVRVHGVEKVLVQSLCTRRSGAEPTHRRQDDEIEAVRRALDVVARVPHQPMNTLRVPTRVATGDLDQVRMQVDGPHVGRAVINGRAHLGVAASAQYEDALRSNGNIGDSRRKPRHGRVGL